MNKKGFTLIELLAVIVILSVIILVAVTAVIPQMKKARLGAFINDAQVFLDGAETYYQVVQSENGTWVNQTPASLVANGYVKKIGYDKYKGCIKFNTLDSKIVIRLANSEFMTIDPSGNSTSKYVNAEQLSQYSSTNESVVPKSGTENYGC